eukprot:6208049-Pleurochrysis_carterae.AAC.1
MASGCDSLPGGIAAWLPSVCFILIEAHKEARQAATASRSQRLSPEAKHLQDADVEAADAKASREGSRSQAGSASTPAPRGGYVLEADSEAGALTLRETRRMAAIPFLSCSRRISASP